MSAGPVPQTPGSASLYSYSANTSTSTVSQQQRALGASASRHSPHPSLPPSSLGAAVPNAANILERPLNRTRTQEVSLAAWAFMLAEIISYSQSRVDSVNDLEKR